MRVHNRNIVTKKKTWLFLWQAKQTNKQKGLDRSVINETTSYNWTNVGMILTHFFTFMFKDYKPMQIKFTFQDLSS